jgi:prepilin-type N-terminal cleavage/methylation domain-containing protein
MGRNRKTAGFTLLEMLISVVILGIIALGLERVLASTLSSQANVTDRQDVLLQVRLAMERMVMFVQETDEIANPVGSNEEVLKVSERILDTYDNSSHVYAAGGDGKPDADNNADGAVNAGSNDTADYITYTLDKSDGANWKLMEQMPNYGSAPSGLLTSKTICEHVTEFHCTRLPNTSVVDIRLSVANGKASTSLHTRARARLVQ